MLVKNKNDLTEIAAHNLSSKVRFLQKDTVLAIFLISSSLLSIPAFSGIARAQVSTSSYVFRNSNVFQDLIKPPVVFIYNNVSATLVSPIVGLFIQNLQQQLHVLSKQKQLDLTDPNAVLDTILSSIEQDPATYVGQGSTTLLFSMPQLGGIGSGFIVTHDGYIVTNYHVIQKISARDIYQKISSDQNAAISVFGPQAIADANNELTSFLPQKFPVLASIQPTQDDVYRLARVFLNYYETNFSASNDDVDQHVYVFQRPAGPLGLTPIEAEVIPSATGQFPGKDVAILKVEGNNNLPTIPLGDESTITNDLFAVGFPGAVSESPVLQQSGLQPTVTKGTFSGFQPSNYGFNYIQSQTPTSHGNSGGPLVNASGYVVGITQLGTINPVTGQEETGFNLFLPISIAKEFLSRINVQPHDSDFTSMYRQGLIEYDQQHYKNALNILENINLISPGNYYVQHYMVLSQQEINAGHDLSTTLPTISQNGSSQNAS